MKKFPEDILQWPFIGAIIKAKYFPFIPQLFTLAIYFSLIWGGIGVYQNEARNIEYIGDTNWANLVIWGLWWPLIICSSVFLGRVWCTICPMELVSSLANKIGLGWNFPWRKHGDILMSGTFLAVVLPGILGFQMDLIPQRTALYLIVLFLMVFLTGFLFQKRTFCNYLCPVGHLLGIHAWCAPVEWRVKNPAVCASCKNKPCISKSNYNNFFARSCTSNLYPPEISNNQDCLLCTQCAKSCDKNNLSFRFRKFFADIFSGRTIPISVVIYSIILSGFLLYELGVLWRPFRNSILFLPDWILFKFEIESHWGIAMIRGIMVILIYPAILWLIPVIINRRSASADRLLKSGSTVIEYLKVSAVSYFPILAAVHLIIGLQDTAPRIRYIPLVLQDPEGIQTANLLVSRTLRLSRNLPPVWDTAISIVQVLLILIGIAVAIAAVVRITKRNMEISLSAPLLGIILYGGIFLALIVFWKFL